MKTLGFPLFLGAWAWLGIFAAAAPRLGAARLRSRRLHLCRLARRRRPLRPQGAPVRFALPYPPGKNQMWRAVAGRVLLSREARAYFAAVKRQVLALKVVPMEGPLSVQVDVYRPRKAGDLDGRLPAVLDALNGLAWNDDSQVVRLVATRHDDKAAPRVEVSITPADAPTTKLGLTSSPLVVAAEFEPTLKSQGSLKPPSNSRWSEMNPPPRAAKGARLMGPTMAALATSATLRPIARPVCAGCSNGKHDGAWDKACVCKCHGEAQS